MSENSTIAADNAGPQRTDPPVDVSLPTFERVQAFIVAARSGKYVVSFLFLAFL